MVHDFVCVYIYIYRMLVCTHTCFQIFVEIHVLRRLGMHCQRSSNGGAVGTDGRGWWRGTYMRECACPVQHACAIAVMRHCWSCQAVMLPAVVRDQLIRMTVLVNCDQSDGLLLSTLSNPLCLATGWLLNWCEGSSR